MEPRSDREARLDAEHPRGQRRFANLVQDRVVEPDRELIDPAARGALERHGEQLLAHRILRALWVCSGAVEIGELARVGEDQRQAEREREVTEQPDVRADLQRGHALPILRDALAIRHVPARRKPGLAPDVGALPLLPQADREIGVERIVVIERVDDRRVLAGLLHEPLLARRHRFVGEGHARRSEHEQSEEREGAGDGMRLPP